MKRNAPSLLLLVLAVTAAILGGSVLPASRPAVAAAMPPTPDVTAGHNSFLTAAS